MKKKVFYENKSFFDIAKTQTRWAIVALQEGACFRNGNTPILENFGNAEVYIFRTPAGYVIPFMHVAKTTGMNSPQSRRCYSEIRKAQKEGFFKKKTSTKTLARRSILPLLKEAGFRNDNPPVSDFSLFTKKKAETWRVFP